MALVRTSPFAIRRAPRLGALILLLALCGCSRVREARQCRTLAETHNPALDEIEELTKQKRTPTSLRAISKRYKALAQSLGPLEFSSKDTAVAVAEYAEVLQRTGEAATRAAEALENQNERLLSSTRRELTTHTQAAKYKLRRIESECHGR